MIRLIELFAGVGSQTQALKNIGVEHEVVAICEIDKYAEKSYKAIHGNVNNLGDITKVDKLPDADMWTYSFPCTDLSVSGKMAGLGKGTRSGLLWEVERLLKSSTLPKYLLLENVPTLVGKFSDGFKEWCDILSSLGYTNYWKVLNAKDFGVPQNRKRVFMVSILGEHEQYEFSDGYELTTSLADVLEHDVDDKFYLSDKMIEGFKRHADRHNAKGSGFAVKYKDVTDISGTITARYGKDGKECLLVNTLRANASLCPTDNVIKIAGNIPTATESVGRIYDPSGISPTIDTMQGGNRQPKIICGAIRGRYEDGKVEQKLEINGTDCTNTITTVQKDNVLVSERIRRLTPKECWRLMGFSDEQFKLAETVNSNTQLYKQAGNSIVVPVLEFIFAMMFKDKVNRDYF